MHRSTTMNKGNRGMRVNTISRQSAILNAMRHGGVGAMWNKNTYAIMFFAGQVNEYRELARNWSRIRTCAPNNSPFFWGGGPERSKQQPCMSSLTWRPVLHLTPLTARDARAVKRHFQQIHLFSGRAAQKERARLRLVLHLAPLTPRDAKAVKRRSLWTCAVHNVHPSCKQAGMALDMGKLQH